MWVRFDASTGSALTGSDRGRAGFRGLRCGRRGIFRRYLGELRPGIPTGGCGHTAAEPFHSFFGPVQAPGVIAHAVVVVGHAELEAAAGADLVRTAAGRAARRFFETGIGADGTGVVHRRMKGRDGRRRIGSMRVVSLLIGSSGDRPGCPAGRRNSRGGRA